MVPTIDHGDIGGRAPQRLGGFQPAEAGSDDDHAGTFLFRHGLLLCCRPSVAPSMAVAKRAGRL